MSKSVVSKRCEALIDILKECNIISLVNWEQPTMAGSSMFFVTIKGQTWVFEVDNRCHWKYQFGGIWYNLSNTVEKLLLSERVKSLKPLAK